VSTTPRRYRAVSGGLAALLIILIAVGTAAYVRARDATGRLRFNTGPVLVATQSLLASLAEADAAATAAFLSVAAPAASVEGTPPVPRAATPEDRDQRRLYEDALARANRQLEEVAAIIGSEAAAHTTLGNLAVEITRYAGLVEAARALNGAGATPEQVKAAQARLVDAVTLLSRTIAGDLATLTRVSQARFRADEDGRSGGVPVAVVVAVVVVGALGLAQTDLARRSRRLVNLPLAAATLVVAGILLWTAVADGRAGDDLAAGRRDGYESIVLTARIQAEGFAAKANETLALITGDAAKRVAADQAASRLAAVKVDSAVVEAARAGELAAPRGPQESNGGLLLDAAASADSARERAAASEMLERWQRYRSGVETLRQASGDDARRLATGDVSSTFNGFNVSVESVLSDNRAQFSSALARAAHRTRGLNLVVLAGGALAIALVLAGYQLRIHEYR
jgi:hypothetical protein